MSNPIIAESLLSKKQRLHELPEDFIILCYNGRVGCLPDDTTPIDGFESLVDYFNEQLKTNLDNCYEMFESNKGILDAESSPSPLAIWKDLFTDGMGISLKRIGKDRGYYTLSKRGINLLWEDFLTLLEWRKSGKHGEQTVFEFASIQYSFVVVPLSDYEPEF